MVLKSAPEAAEDWPAPANLLIAPLPLNLAQTLAQTVVLQCVRRFALPSALVITAALLAGCGSVPRGAGSDAAGIKSGKSSGLPRAGSGKGGYYKDDGPGDTIPEGLENTPDAIPRVEPYSSRANKPYAVFGLTYTPILDDRPLKQRGRGSWYGKKFHGQRTSSGEPYDMFQMTAAHPTLPIPSYARVTNVITGKQVIVRVNDRGPFLSDRIIDLSYTAALKLGYLGHGSAELEVERLLPDEIARINSNSNRMLAQAQAPAQGEGSTMAMAMPVPVPVPAVAALPLAQGIPSRSPASASVLPPRPVLSTASRSTQLAQAQSPQSAQPLQAPQSLQLQSAPLSSAAPTSLPPSAQMTPTQAGEPAQVEVMQALTPVVESSELPAQPVSLAPAMQAHSANDAYASQAGQNTASASAPAMAAQGLAHGSSGASNAGGIYLQFGAFSQATNADAARERLARNWNNAMPLPQVVMNGNLYRVYSGPFSSRQEADAAARQLEGAGAGKSVIVLR